MATEWTPIPFIPQVLPRRIQAIRKKSLGLPNSGGVKAVGTITAILAPEVDGSVRLPLPPELRHVMVKVEAKLEPAEMSGSAPRFGCLAGKIRLAPDFDEPLEDLKDYPGSWTKQP